MAEKASKAVARPMYFLSVIAAPFVWILAKSTEAMFNLLGIKEAESKVTEEEIKSIVQEGKEDGEVQEVEQDIVERVFLLGDLKVSSLMTHRSDIVALDIHNNEEEIKAILEENLYETYPVIDRTFDNTLGIVGLKDLIFRFGQKNAFKLEEVVRPATYFHDNMSVYKALEQMKEHRLSQAFICDEFGSFQGIITLKDISADSWEALRGQPTNRKSSNATSRTAGWSTDSVHSTTSCPTSTRKTSTTATAITAPWAASSSSCSNTSRNRENKSTGKVSTSR